MAFKILVEVNTGHYFGFIVTLGEYNAQVLLFGGIAFKGVGWTGTAGGFAFAVIDLPVLKNVFYFRLGDMAAFHPAFRMLRVFEIAHTPIQSIVAVGIVGFSSIRAGFMGGCVGAFATPDGNGRNNHQAQEQIGKRFFHEWCIRTGTAELKPVQLLQ